MKTILATILSAAFAGAAFAQVTSLINYQGRLTDANGDPVTGSKNFSISIYDAATGGNLLYTESIGAVPLDSSGVYSFQFGAGGNSSKQVTETVAVTNGTSITFQKVLANSPVVAGTVSVSDGTYAWSQSAGSSNEDDFGVAYSTNLRRVTVIYYNGAPAAGRTITASYRYTDGSISGALASGSEHWMAISVSGLTQGTRQRVLAVPFALNSQSAEIANSIPDGIVTADKLADGALRDASAREGNVLMTAQKRPDIEAEGFVLAGSLDLTTSRKGSEYEGLATYGGDADAVWTGTEMIVWNGSNMPQPDPENVVITGGRYNPVTDTWTTMSSTGEPRFSYSHTAVWAGTEMIVFGAGNNEVTNNVEFTGGRYNPVTDTWSTTSSIGAPTFSQYSNTAVWTGTEMIVFGEGNNSITNNSEITGSRYNPVTNTWTTMSSTEAPTFASNSSYTAIWTGTEMIVFGEGGYNGSGYDGIVGLRYNPLTNTWATMSSTDSPTLRGNLSVVWTGLEMVVLVNSNTSLEYKIGGSRYNPVTDTWTEISSRSLPNFRLDTASSPTLPCVWTGAEIIVFGPDDGVMYNQLLLGGRYNPASDTWNVISNPNFSEKWDYEYNTEVKALWTGSNVILFSGASPSNPARTVIITPRQTFMYVKP